MLDERARPIVERLAVGRRERAEIGLERDELRSVLLRRGGFLRVAIAQDAEVRDECLANALRGLALLRGRERMSYNFV